MRNRHQTGCSMGIGGDCCTCDLPSDVDFTTEISEFKREVAKPEWLDDGLKSAMDTFRLALAGSIPNKIKAWMIVTSCLRVLRAIYGSDLETAAGLRVSFRGGIVSFQ